MRRKRFLFFRFWTINSNSFVYTWGKKAKEKNQMVKRNYPFQCQSPAKLIRAV